MPKSRKVKPGKKKRVFDEFFNIDKIPVSYELADGTMSEDKEFLIFERGEASAILLFNAQTYEVVLVRQFRAPTLDKTDENGWLTETIAGMVRENETPLSCILRESFEETGYDIKNAEFITKFFPSPGGSSEVIHLFFAEVRNCDRTSAGGGIKKDGEHIEVIQVPVDEFFSAIDVGAYSDAKILLAAPTLASYLNKTRPGAKTPAPSGEIKYRIKGKPDQIIGIKTGNIIDVAGVDVWVNSENNDMMMDRIVGKSVSANIRNHGSRRNGSGEIEEDSIANALLKAMKGRNFVRIGTVVDTESGALYSKGVQRIYHVATVRGEPGRGFKANLDDIASKCIPNLFANVVRRNKRIITFDRKDKSILIPLIGTGDGELVPEAVVPIMINAILTEMAKNGNQGPTEVFLSAFSDSDVQICQAEMDKIEGLTRLS